MKILTIDSNDTGDADPSEWDEEILRAVQDADIVLFMFAPHSHMILKDRTGDTEVVDVRRSYRDGKARWRFLAGSHDYDTTVAEGARR